MGSIVGGGLLLVLALFMLVGFLNADVDRAAGTTLIAILITVALPAGAGVFLISRRARSGKRLDERREALRRQTIEAELVKLAGRKDGKLTVVEVVSELGVSPESAEAALQALARRDLADIQVTESGLLVYAFHDVRRLSEKPDAKGILDG